jgi:hypothetical protein
MIPNEDHDEASTTKVEIKYKAPSRYDMAPYGQIWKVIGENNESTVWVQVSKVEEPNWLNITSLFNGNLQELLRTGEFQKLISTLI